MSLLWVFTYGVDLGIHFRRWVYSRWEEVYLEMSSNLCFSVYNVDVVMAAQSKIKIASICGQPVGALHIHPANLNIWMMTQDARSTLLNQSFPICHSDKASSVPADGSARHTQRSWFISAIINLSYSGGTLHSAGDHWVMHANNYFSEKHCFSCKTTKSKYVTIWKETTLTS